MAHFRLAFVACGDATRSTSHDKNIGVNTTTLACRDIAATWLAGRTDVRRCRRRTTNGTNGDDDIWRRRRAWATRTRRGAATLPEAHYHRRPPIDSILTGDPAVVVCDGGLCGSWHSSVLGGLGILLYHNALTSTYLPAILVILFGRRLPFVERLFVDDTNFLPIPLLSVVPRSFQFCSLLPFLCIYSCLFIVIPYARAITATHDCCAWRNSRLLHFCVPVLISAEQNLFSAVGQMAVTPT